MHADGADLLGIVPMGGQAILLDEMADARRDDPQDGSEGAVGHDTLTRSLARALGRTVGDHFGDGRFQKFGRVRTY